MKYKKEHVPGSLFNAFQAKKKNWIANAIKKPGALHAQLGVKQGTKIPTKKLAAAAKKGGKLGRRARLAETLKGLHHKKKKGGLRPADVVVRSEQNASHQRYKGMRCKKRHKHGSACM